MGLHLGCERWAVDLMAESISIEPHWPNLRRWVRHVAKTDPETAAKIAAEMGDEAPDLTPDLIVEASELFGSDNTEYNRAILELTNRCLGRTSDDLAQTEQEIRAAQGEG